MPGVAIGAHTVSHPSLAELDEDAERRELADSRQALEGVLGRRVDLLAYPFGKSADVSARTLASAAAAGFRAAVTTQAAPVLPSTGRYAIPRLTAHEWDEAELVRRLRSLAGLRRGGPG
jgi:peptidoglycan/xylan/chitin deacetylase (PgdA/CDA1 family)